MPVVIKFCNILLALASLAKAQHTQSMTGGNATHAGGSSSGSPHPIPPKEYLNPIFTKYLYVVLAFILTTLATFRVIIWANHYIRTLVCLNDGAQVYFRKPNLNFAGITRHLVYAPLFRKRHSEEISIGATGMGTLPSRLQSLVLIGIIGVNIAFCVVGMEWHDKKQEICNQLRNRTGTLAVANMLPLVIMGGRNNPLIGWLRISFDTFNLVHRWFGRIVAVETVAHMIAFTVYKVDAVGWHMLGQMFSTQKLFTSGLISMVAFVVIILQAYAPIRHAFYETFLHIHIALAVTVIAGLWVHLDGHWQKKLLLCVIMFWAFERIFRLSSLLYRNMGHGGTSAIIEALPGDALRLTLHIARPWTFQPGQYIFLTLPKVGLWTSHPFSVAWSDSSSDLDSEKGIALSPSDILPRNTKQTMSLIIRRRTGFTDTLFQKASNHRSSRLILSAYIEGPYGIPHSLTSYGTLLLFAGGVGITSFLPSIRSLLADYSTQSAAIRRITLVWIIQSPAHLEWIRPWMTEILAMENRREVLKIMLFVTRPRSTKEICSPSATVQMFPGKPDVDALVGIEVEKQIGAMGVGVCGPGGLGDDVRGAVRRRIGESCVEFFEERYGW